MISNSRNVTHPESSSCIYQSLTDLQLRLAKTQGSAFLDACSTELNKVLKADCTFIGTIADEKVKTLSFATSEGIQKNFEYPHGGTLKYIHPKETWIFNHSVGSELPEGTPLHDIQLHSIISTPLFAHDKSPLGIIVALFSTPIENEFLAKTSFDLLSSRIQAELEHQLMQKQITKQQEYYHFAMEAGKLGLYDFSVEKDVAIFNQRLHEIIGYKPGEIIASLQWWISRVHPEDRWQFDTYTERGDQALQKRKYRIKLKSGEYRWVETQSIRIESDKAGKSSRIIGLINDIHQEREAAILLEEAYEYQKNLNEVLKEREEALIQNQSKLITQMSQLQVLHREVKESELRWSYALEGNGDGVIEWDMAKGTSRFSKRAQEILGFSLENDGQVAKFYEHVHPLAVDQFRHCLDQSTRAPFHPFQMETQILDDNGVYRWVLFRGKVVETDYDQKPVRMVGTVTDLSEQKVVQKELTIYEEMIKQNQSAILFVSMSGTIEFMNAAALELLHYQEHEIVGKNIQLIQHTKAALLQNARRTECSIISKGGKKIMVQASTSQLCEEDEPIGYVLNLLDVSEKKQLEDKVSALTLAKVEAELQAQREQTDMIIKVQEYEKETIARELHDGIGQMLSLTKLHLEQIDEDLSPVVQQRLHSIRDLIQQVIVDVKGLTCELMPLSVRNMGLQAATLDLLEHYAKLGQGKFTVQSKINLNGYVIDPSIEVHIYRIIQECINNTFKYAEPDTLSLVLVKLKNSINLLIEDDGKGFDVAERLNKKNGFGLKTIMKRTKLINGKLNVSSTPGQGTVVNLTIPTTN